MNGRQTLMLVGVLALMATLTAGLTQAQDQGPQASTAPSALVGTAFTYQGRLTDGSGPVNGNCDFVFELYDEAGSGSPPTGGTLLGTENKPGVLLTDGLFTVQLDFGGAFYGEARWLEIEVDCGSGAATLSPRQPLTPVPYALALPGLVTLENATSPNVVGGWWGNGVAAEAVGVTIGGGGQSGYPNQVTADFGTVGGGDNNAVSANYGTIGGGGSNSASSFVATIGGGASNTASGQAATVGGGLGNSAVYSYTTVSGGQGNTASGGWATVGGGWDNTASGYAATVGGGDGNEASGGIATIGGGDGNEASGWFAVIGGGGSNEASGDYATVGGGAYNVVNATIGTIPGGYEAAASHYGEMAYSSGKFANPGDAQTSVYVLRNTSAGGAWTELFLDGSDDRLTIAEGRTLTFDVWVVGRSDGGESAGYHFWGVIENEGGTTAFIGGSWGGTLGEDDGQWNARVRSDSSNQALAIEVLGNGETIRWVAYVRTVEVAW